MFLHEAYQIPRTDLLLRPCDPENSKNLFSGSNFSDNSVQVLSSMHSNVQLLYLLLFFAVGVAVLVAKACRTLVNLQRALVIRNKLDRQIFLVCGELLSTPHTGELATHTCYS